MVTISAPGSGGGGVGMADPFGSVQRIARASSHGQMRNGRLRDLHMPECALNSARFGATFDADG
jgi:hypothetical protein